MGGVATSTAPATPIILDSRCGAAQGQMIHPQATRDSSIKVAKQLDQLVKAV